MTDWIQCPSCDEEFKIVSDSTEKPYYCPFCAEELELDEELDDEDEWE